MGDTITMGDLKRLIEMLSRNASPSRSALATVRCPFCGAREGERHDRRCPAFRQQPLVTYAKRWVEVQKRLNKAGLPVVVRVPRIEILRITRGDAAVMNVAGAGFRPAPKRVWRRHRDAVVDVTAASWTT